MKLENLVSYVTEIEKVEADYLESVPVLYNRKNKYVFAKTYTTQEGDTVLKLMGFFNDNSFDKVLRQFSASRHEFMRKPSIHEIQIGNELTDKDNEILEYLNKNFDTAVESLAHFLASKQRQNYVIKKYKVIQDFLNNFILNVAYSN